MIGKKILAADDEPQVLRVVRDKLASVGYMIVTATNGEEALRVARAESPDLILLGVMMPKMSGFEVCRALRSDPAFRAIPIFLLTARGQEIDRQTGLEAGATEYIMKPFSPRHLLQAVQKRLGQAVATDTPSAA